MEKLKNDWMSKNDILLRRRCIFDSMPKEWSNNKKLLHTAIALEKISISIKDNRLKRTAKRDSEYYYNQLKSLREIGKRRK